mmetsp:Transcript_15673/g.33511  ORF Transcript_15673/g.33511 Transcript_15673/m.33511 type:complete len:204 (-) Transcript_15673:2367-2978(-)
MVNGRLMLTLVPAKLVVHKEPAVLRGLGARKCDELVSSLLDVLGERLALNRHHRHVLHPSLEPGSLLKLGTLRVVHPAVVAYLVSQLPDIVLCCGWREPACRALGTLRLRAARLLTQRSRHVGHSPAIERTHLHGRVGGEKSQSELSLMIWGERARNDRVAAPCRQRYLSRHFLSAHGKLRSAQKASSAELLRAADELPVALK